MKGKGRNARIVFDESYSNTSSMAYEATSPAEIDWPKRHIYIIITAINLNFTKQVDFSAYDHLFLKTKSGGKLYSRNSLYRQTAADRCFGVSPTQRRENGHLKSFSTVSY